jgi:hypothetical protein
MVGLGATWLLIQRVPLEFPMKALDAEVLSKSCN